MLVRPGFEPTASRSADRRLSLCITTIQWDTITPVPQKLAFLTLKMTQNNADQSYNYAIGCFSTSQWQASFSTLATIIYKSIFTLHTQDSTIAATDEECCSSKTAVLLKKPLVRTLLWVKT